MSQSSTSIRAANIGVGQEEHCLSMSDIVRLKKTLTDQEVEDTHKVLVDYILEKTGGQVRI